jgi:ribosomal protein L19
MQYSSVDLEPQARKLSIEKEDLLARKKQYYMREDKLKIQE